MKKLLPVVIVGLLCLVGCSKIKEALAKKPRNLTTNPLVIKGVLFLDPETLEPYSGKVYEQGSGGKLDWEGVLLNGKKHGLHTSYRTGGTKDKETNFKEGKQHGLDTSYNRDGTKSFETNYKEGKKHGLSVSYDANGTKTSESQFKDGTVVNRKFYSEGEQHGTETWYYEDGTAKKECQYSNGVKGECKKPKRRY